MLEKQHPLLSLRCQCDLLGISRSGLYYEPAPCSVEDMRIMHVVDVIFTEDPTFGSRRITAVLVRHGFVVNRKRVIRLMQEMGLKALYPKKAYRSAEPRYRYPYLLSGLQIVTINHVWATDITYVRMEKGFLYLTVVMDWHSRYVLSWRLSNTLDASFCLEALEEALERYPKPQIFNSDQGCQYTSKEFTDRLLLAEIEISMAGKGRCYDNIFVERLWRTVKYQEIYLKSYASGFEAQSSLAEFFERYNERRPHQSLSYKTPKEVYFGLEQTKWLSPEHQADSLVA
jgi:putative transposase